MKVESSMIAFLDGPDTEDIPNKIHSTTGTIILCYFQPYDKGAQAFGFQKPLISGVTVFSWTCANIIKVMTYRKI
jgi:hypothetical protein